VVWPGGVAQSGSERPVRGGGRGDRAGGGKRRKKTREATRRLEVTGTLDRRAAEALYLEMRRLARRYGVDVAEFRIER
jgi:hypothetical protein